MDNLHIVYTSYGSDYGWAISSPQIPELIGGRKTIDELLRDTEDILRFAGVSSYGRLWRHEQIATEDPHGNEYLIRWLVDDQVSDDDADDPMSRSSTAGRLLSSAQKGYPEYLLRRQPQLITGERLLIAVMAYDTIGYCMDQLEDGQGAIIALHRGEDAIYSVPLGISAGLDGWTWELEDLGLTRDDLVTTTVDRVLDWEANRLGSRSDALKIHALTLPPSRIPKGEMVHLNPIGSRELH
ncbi:hypothetical protein CH278_01935 [Rhodococcus sp. 05-2254-5]|uniref:hypothetical protein n=1 Tax=unclassified Rhodococcus (in: high G+C Gram-positive bacteria) TaxID=192944 RepID=UPI000B9A5338|nr:MULTISPECIES: hypothetical protein [unclassified Rhodococcus (in: high G+C Gram-positive bacteria)]OZE39069.1 hypothetical protein CH278_01935 [Rhodococcus sp. 05-2254-5]OZE59010.1 hypothetical protein CH269_08430 [Rhodococcus sp. 05-2254-1]